MNTDAENFEKLRSVIKEKHRLPQINDRGECYILDSDDPLSQSQSELLDIDCITSNEYGKAY